MYKIYKITNSINSKVYIGQTAYSLKKRFSEHINRAKSEPSITRPLYNAIRKYGAENFIIEEIESNLTKEEANIREQYWIKYFNSFKGNGYNATEGGDSRSYIAKNVYQISMVDYTVLNIFTSTHEAGKSLGKPNAHISKACSGNRRSAYGYYWLYEDDYNTIKDLQQYFQTQEKVQKVAKIDPVTHKIIKEYKSCWQAAKELNLDAAHIRRVCKGQRKTHGNFSWKYI